VIRVLFTTIWWFGFFVALGLMLGLYLGVEFIEQYVGILFLAVGIQHMIALVLLGFFAIIKERDDNIEVGNRVATMGYLHTLIGTSVALIMTSKFGGAEMIEHIDTIISPIGSALITSIIGWAFGKEMERERYRYKLESTEQSDNALEFLADRVKRSAYMIEQGSQKWMESMEYSSTQLIASSQKLEQSVNSATKISEQSIEELTRSFNRLFEQMERAVNDVERNFEATSKDANRVFKNSINTFDNGLSQMNTIAKEWDRHIKSMKKFSNHSESALESLTEHSQKVIDEFSSVAKSLPSAGKVISDIDEFLSKLKKSDR
jgi:archaellum component FlaC